MSKKIVKIQTGYGPEMMIRFIGGCKPYLWIGSDDNYGYVSDRSVRKLRRFCDSIIRSKPKKRKVTQSQNVT